MCEEILRENISDLINHSDSDSVGFGLFAQREFWREILRRLKIEKISDEIWMFQRPFLTWVKPKQHRVTLEIAADHSCSHSHNYTLTHPQ